MRTGSQQVESIHARGVQLDHILQECKVRCLTLRQHLAENGQRFGQPRLARLRPQTVHPRAP